MPHPSLTRRVTAWIASSLASLGLLVLISACTSDDERARRESTFTAEVEHAFRARAPSLHITRSAPLELQIRNEQGQTWTYRLGAMHDEVLADPQGKARIIDRFVTRTLAYRPMALVADQATIVPVLRHRGGDWGLAHAARVGATKPSDPIVSALGDQWLVAYRRGTGAAAAYMTAASLAEVGLTPERLHAVAVENLRKHANSIDAVQHHLFTLVTAGGDFDPSLVLLDELWRDRRFAVEGDVVVAILEPDGLLVTGSRSAAGVAHLKSLANLGRPAGRPPVRLMTYRDGRFQDLPE